MNWTKEQQDAIEIRNRNILVSAAAGSGKTAVLVERIKQLILRDQVPLDHMLIVTFSNAAASEMREKIVESISRELEESTDSSKKNSFLRDQLDLIHRANISTFHAFSMEVIRRYFYLIDIEPNFKICDEAQKTILQAEAMEQLFSTLFESGNQDFINFLSKFAATKNDDAAKEMIFEAHNFIQSIPDSFEWLRAQADALACSREAFEVSAAFREIKDEIRRNLTTAEASFTRAGEILEEQGIASLLPKWKREMDAIRALKKDFNTLPFDQFGIAVSNLKFQTYTASKSEKADYEAIKESVSSLRNQGKGIVRKLSLQYFSRPVESYVEDLNRTHGDARYLCFLVEEFDRLYKEKKQNKGLIDFSDIEHYALAVLAREEAASEYRDKFEYIFIDEYQDSNIVQETLIGKIKRENNLFMVGDVKQSIYKFRLAEPEIFIGKYEAFRENRNEFDVKLDLNKNFRSKGRIIGAVNDIFRQIMKKDISGLEYDDDASLYPGSPYEGMLDYPVELYLLDDIQLEDPALDEEIREMKKAEIEALKAVQIIREQRGLMIYDAKRDEERPVANKDIVILLRSAKGYAELYYEALMREGIPAFVDSSDGYFDTLEIEVFLNLLRIIDNRKQDIPLLSVLRSPIFGFSLEQMIKIRVQTKEGSYHAAFWAYSEHGGEPDLKKECESVLDRLYNWKKDAVLMPLEDFLWKLIRETGYYEYIGGIPGGSQRQANLRALTDKAVQFQSSQMKGLFGFINYIEAIRKQKVPMGQVKLLGENDDVIRIMTIHKSKGLEFPVVLVGGLGKRFNRDSNTYQVSLHKDIGVGIRVVDQENGCYKKTIIQTAIDQKKKRESLAEELRILYVAFTRAMDRLILLGTKKDAEAAMDSYFARGAVDFSGARSYLDFLIPAMEKTEIIFLHSNRRDISISREETEQKKNDIRRMILGGFPEAHADRDELKREIQRRFGYEYGHREAVGLKSKFTVSELGRMSEGGFREPGAPASLETPKFKRQKSTINAAERGAILHKVMEHLDFRRPGDVRTTVADLVNRQILTAEEAATVAYRKIIGFFGSEIGKRAFRAEKLYKETSFNIKKEMFGEKVIIQGTIDCYFEEGGKYILLDYKSNYIGDPEDEEEINRVAESYRTQLALYREALEKIRGVKVEETYLYLFSIGKGIRIN